MQDRESRSRRSGQLTLTQIRSAFMKLKIELDLEGQDIGLVKELVEVLRCRQPVLSLSALGMPHALALGWSHYTLLPSIADHWRCCTET